MVSLLLLAAATAQPSPEALRLGREIAGSGTLAALLPLIKQQQVGELIAAHRELGVSDQAQLRVTADRVFASGRDRILDAEGRAYAANLSLSDLRTIAEFYRTTAAKRLQVALPKVIQSTMGAMQGVDFKADVLAAYCKDAGKLCAK